MEKFKLDFSIISSKDRLEAIRSIDLTKLNKTELETVTNYVIYGKDEDGTSSVDRKEIQIQTKFNSYKKNTPIQSLDELMESPTFDESSLKAPTTKYTKPKAHIDLEKANTIPEFRELRQEIERLQEILDVSKGKKENPNIKPLDSKQQYYLNHHLISLRTQQYYLMDAYFPQIGMQKNRMEYHGAPAQGHMGYEVYPRGVETKPHDRIFENPKLDDTGPAVAKKEPSGGEFYFDFRVREHLYYLIGYYEEIEDMVKNTPDSPLWNLLWTLDFYIEKANLSEQQRLIVEDKKCQKMNKEIKEHLEKELGISHQENYISTIWSKAIGKIIEAVELNYDEWLCKDYGKAWKRCTRCGEWKLRDSRNFVRKAKAYDGLTNKCKMCEKEIRQAKKG